MVKGCQNVSKECRDVKHIYILTLKDVKTIKKQVINANIYQKNVILKLMLRKWYRKYLKR